jgi:hypothetical protein
VEVNFLENNNKNNNGFENPEDIKLIERRFRDNRIMRAIFLLALLVIAGFALTWAFPRNIAEKPPAAPAPAPTQPGRDNTTIITERVSTVEGVEDARVIVLSRIALIALDLKSDIPLSQVKIIKSEAASRAKDLPEIDEVLVTANPGLFEEVVKILEGDAPLERLEYIYESIRDQNL